MTSGEVSDAVALALQAIRLGNQSASSLTAAAPDSRCGPGFGVLLEVRTASARANLVVARLRDHPTGQRV
ncbi:MAG: hypothetical protein ACOH17_09955 [Cellulomonas sp.]